MSSKYEKIFGTGWCRVLLPFLETEDFKKIGRTVKKLVDGGQTIHPLFDNVFRAFKECPWETVVTVWLTTNCYLEDGRDGLAFSHPSKFIDYTPPALTKIFDGVERDVCDGLYLKRENDLTRWANQGVLLLNLDLTNEHGKIGTHIELWKPFIDYVIKTLETINSGIIYALIGKEAWKYNDVISPLGNDIFLIEHPQSAVIKKRDWKSKHIFSRTNKISDYMNGAKIDWAR